MAAQWGLELSGFTLPSPFPPGWYMMPHLWDLQALASYSFTSHLETLGAFFQEGV